MAVRVVDNGEGRVGLQRRLMGFRAVIADGE